MDDSKKVVYSSNIDDERATDRKLLYFEVAQASRSIFQIIESLRSRVSLILFLSEAQQ